ncbi:hypothetical protein [Parafrankia soli]|uniref:hypothetical protein n=1 Tax=Parafrankia soli TaxID=2599596 RepID=UPI0018E2FAEA|nr:hypothetical protein [Parafrankia soli]
MNRPAEADHDPPGAGSRRAVELINDGQVPTADLLDDSLPLESFEEAFALLDRG